jgi:signal transduction histidine kinase
MKIDNLIEKDYFKVSVLKSMPDVLDSVVERGFIAVEDADLIITGIITLKDFHLNQNGNIADCNLDKPHAGIGQTLFDTYDLMRSSQSDYLPVFHLGQFIGVISATSITVRLIILAKEAKQNYQKVIHDIRNPIANIQGLIVLLGEPIDEEEKNNLLRLTNQSVDHAMDILEDLLFVELDENKPLNLEQTELNSFLRDCIDAQNGICQLKNIYINSNISEDTFIRSIDRLQFKRAIHNVMSNAIKFSSPGSIVKVSSKIENKRIVIKIVDSGIGIPERMQHEIFNKFTSAQRSGTSGEASTGLGLSFTKHCIERHHGTITFKSVEGKGTKFYITI